jgi:hypothetical protein
VRSKQAGLLGILPFSLNFIHTYQTFRRLPASPCSESVPEPGTPLSRRGFKSVVEDFPRFQVANQYFFSESSKVLNEGSLGGWAGRDDRCWQAECLNKPMVPRATASKSLSLLRCDGGGVVQVRMDAAFSGTRFACAVSKRLGPRRGRRLATDPPRVAVIGAGPAGGAACFGCFGCTV